MMDRYGSEKKYNKQMINAFKKSDEPEIIIVVDKLLTGFDAPCNTVLYLTRSLKDHTLLQAIARVNRLFAVKGSEDTEVYQEHLRDEERRAKFYERFSAFGRAIALALASTTFLEQTPEKQINLYKKDLKFFRNLRAEASIRFQERIDFSEYEPKIKKLLDTHVGAGDVEQLIEPIDLLNTEQREEILGREDVSKESKADMVASAARHTIEQEYEKDPAFYTKFSAMLEDVLNALHEKRLQAADALAKIKDIAIQVATHTEDDIPSQLIGHDMARRYYGTVQEEIVEYITATPDVGATIALEVVKRVDKHKVRDWVNNPDALNAMRREIDDIFFEVAGEFELKFPLEIQDKLIDKCLEVAIANESQRNS